MAAAKDIYTITANKLLDIVILICKYQVTEMIVKCLRNLHTDCLIFIVGCEHMPARIDHQPQITTRLPRLNSSCRNPMDMHIIMRNPLEMNANPAAADHTDILGCLLVEFTRFNG